MKESTTDKIIRRTGRKPVSCSCTRCQNQCKVAPCLGTPDDIEKIIDAGHGKNIMETDWASGIRMGVTKEVVSMFQAKFESEHGGCIFFKDGKCTLHESGLKPTEGKLSHHSTKLDNFDPKKSLSWNVAKEWIDPDNFLTIARISQKLRTHNT